MKRILLSILTMSLLVSCVQGQGISNSSSLVIPEESKQASILEPSEQFLQDEVSSQFISKIENPKPTTPAIIADWKAPAITQVIGNSITSSTGGIGMCASDEFHDYYYLVSEFINKANPDAKIFRTGGGGWENSLTSLERKDWWEKNKSKLDSKAELVIIQLSDNVNTEEKQKTFEKDGIELVQKIQKYCPKAKVLWVSTWYISEKKNEQISNICKETNATFVDIGDLFADKSNLGKIGDKRSGFYGEAWTIKTNGEASHPADKGMKKIAEFIIEAMKGIEFK